MFLHKRTSNIKLLLDAKLNHTRNIRSLRAGVLRNFSDNIFAQTVKHVRKIVSAKTVRLSVFLEVRVVQIVYWNFHVDL